MITFNELKISPDNKCLIIDAQITDEEYFDDVYIESVVIDSQDTYNCTGPSSNPLYQLDIANNKCYNNKRRIKLHLQISDLDITKKLRFSDTIFFVYIIAGGIPRADTPCNRDVPIKMGTVVNLYPLYQIAMEFINNIGGCELPQEFVDLILRLKAFELAIKTGNYNKAISLWKSLLAKDNKGELVLKSNCGCHART